MKFLARGASLASADLLRSSKAFRYAKEVVQINVANVAKGRLRSKEGFK